jgi:hypothetical protein
MSSSISLNILAFIVGALAIISFFIFFKFLLFLKKGFGIVFKNIDTIYQKINNVLDSSKKQK